MQHDFEFEWPLEGRREAHASSLIAFGDGDATAMARTVGLTAAIGADLIMDGALDAHAGLASPTLPAVYRPALARLAALGFAFRERAIAK